MGCARAQRTPETDFTGKGFTDLVTGEPISPALSSEKDENAFVALSGCPSYARGNVAEQNGMDVAETSVLVTLESRPWNAPIAARKPDAG